MFRRLFTSASLIKRPSHLQLVSRNRYSTETPNADKVDTEAPTFTPSTIETPDLASLKDSYLRALADMENLRQRTKREVESAGQFAIQRFAKDIVGVADVLEMAVSSQGRGGEENELKEGLEMTLEELRKVLRTHGVVAVEALNQRFDPNLHMALYEVPSGDVEPGTVISVQKKGYVLHGRIIRAAQVAVSRKP